MTHDHICKINTTYPKFLSAPPKSSCATLQNHPSLYPSPSNHRSVFFIIDQVALSGVLCKWNYTTCPLFLGKRGHFIQPNDFEIFHTAVCIAFLLLGDWHLNLPPRNRHLVWLQFLGRFPLLAITYKVAGNIGL